VDESRDAEVNAAVFVDGSADRGIGRVAGGDDPVEQQLVGGQGARRPRWIERRPRAVKVRLLEEEHRALAVLAADQGVSIPRLLVESARSTDRGQSVTQRRAAMMEMVAVRRLLAGVANNINQIAKAANTGQLDEVGERCAREFAALRMLSDKIAATVDEMAKR